MSQTVVFRFDFDTFFRWNIISCRLPFIAIPSPPWPAGIFTEWTVMTKLSRALNLAFDWATFSNTDQITSPVIWSFLLKLIPIALSFTLTLLLIVTPIISLSSRSRNAYSNNSVTLARKWDVGFESSSPSGGGKRRTVSCVRWALKHMYCLVCSSSIVNLWVWISSCAIFTLKSAREW